MTSIKLLLDTTLDRFNEALTESPPSRDELLTLKQALDAKMATMAQNLYASRKEHGAECSPKEADWRRRTVLSRRFMGQKSQVVQRLLGQYKQDCKGMNGASAFLLTVWDGSGGYTTFASRKPVAETVVDLLVDAAISGQPSPAPVWFCSINEDQAERLPHEIWHSPES